MAPATTPPPSGDILWFDMNYGNDDVDKVLNFGWGLPQKLFDLFNDESFKSVLNREGEKFGVNSELFFKSLDQARLILFIDLGKVQGSLSVEGNRQKLAEQLEKVGCAGDALKLKAGTLNMLASKITKAAGNIINIAKRPLVKVVRKFLMCLNHLLGSLKYVIPGFEAIKEIKEVGENYLAVAEEG
jgi:hypothetical protein